MVHEMNAQNFSLKEKTMSDTSQFSKKVAYYSDRVSEFIQQCEERDKTREEEFANRGPPLSRVEEMQRKTEKMESELLQSLLRSYKDTIDEVHKCRKQEMDVWKTMESQLGHSNKYRTDLLQTIVTQPVDYAGKLATLQETMEGPEKTLEQEGAKILQTMDPEDKEEIATRLRSLGQDPKRFLPDE